MSQVFVRSDQLKDKIFDAKLHISEWKVLFAVDGEKDAGAIAKFLSIPVSDVRATLEKLADMQFLSSGEVASQAVDEESGDISENGAVPEAAEVLAEEEEDLADLTEEAEAAADEDDDLEELEDMFEASLEEELETEADEAAGDEASEEEELDKLIGNLLDEEADDFPEGEAATDTAETEAPDTDLEEEFDLGSIFQEDAETAGQDFDEMLDTMDGGSETETAEAPPEAAPEVGRDGAETILVVDDSVVIRKMVEIALENENYNIVSVATGKEALNYLDENNPDLIILDIMLSDVNGLDVLKAVKASKQIPVVMLSAKDTPRETSKAKQLGADDFIPKPFKDEELVSKIKELIKQ